MPSVEALVLVDAPEGAAVEQGTEHKPLLAFALLHRRERICAILQTRPQGSLCSNQFQPLGAIFGKQGAKPWLRVCVVSER